MFRSAWKTQIRYSEEHSGRRVQGIKELVQEHHGCLGGAVFRWLSQASGDRFGRPVPCTAERCSPPARGGYMTYTIGHIDKRGSHLARATSRRTVSETALGLSRNCRKPRVRGSSNHYGAETHRSAHELPNGDLTRRRIQCGIGSAIHFDGCCLCGEVVNSKRKKGVAVGKRPGKCAQSVFSAIPGSWDPGRTFVDERLGLPESGR